MCSVCMCVCECVFFLSSRVHIYTYRPSIIFTPDIIGSEDLESFKNGSARVSQFRLPAADPIFYTRTSTKIDRNGEI